MGKHKRNKNKHKNWKNKNKDFQHSHYDDKKGNSMAYNPSHLRNSSGKNWDGGSSQSFQERKAPTPEPKEEIAIPIADQMFVWNFCNDVQVGTLDLSALTKVNTWYIAGNGKWLIQKNKALFAGLKKSDVGLDTLPKVNLSEAFIKLAYGKIPESILNQIIAFFKAVMAKHSGSEAFCQVYWDIQESKYMIHVPKQQVSGAAVRYDATLNLDKIEPERYVFVYECHSHNSMGAFWSGTDNADENDLRVYGVFGRLNTDKWEHKHRTIVGKEEIDCGLDLVFDVKPEPTYKVTTVDRTVIVPQSAITLAETYKVRIGEEVISVEASDIQKIEPSKDFPTEWMNEVSGYRSNYQGTGSYAGSPYLPRNYKNESTEEVTETGSDDPAGFFLMAEELAEKIDDLTNGFEDMGTCAEFFDALDSRRLLYPLKTQLQAYLGDFPIEDENEEGTDRDQIEALRQMAQEDNESGKTDHLNYNDFPSWAMPGYGDETYGSRTSGNFI
ncbi:MAG: hypothetical protein PHY47_00990 [Lachnospiraceae bacterium]|nr:hypothetical protein [Lachnospiraceae bacterium]